MRSEEKTLIILTPGFPVDESDSTCLPFLQTFLKSLKNNYPGLDIIVITFHYPSFKGVYEWNGIQIISFNGKNRRMFFKLILWNKIWKKLQQLHKANNIIGVLSLWCNECAFIGKRFSKKNKLKHYCWLWGQDARPGNKYVKRIHPSENELIALSDFLQLEFEKNYSIRPGHVIPPGIDYSLFPEDKSDRTIDILGAGSLIPLKQYDLFLEIIFELKKTLPNIRAALCGKGPEEKALKRRCEQYGLKENVLFTGELPYREVLELMSKSKILLHPSSYEGFGCVCGEALGAGAHVISFCKVMNKKIKQWHIAKDKEEMISKAIEILNLAPPEFISIPDYPIAETSKRVMALFGL
ncbi:MAG TPA: glycosyltransferase family 4 protein [Chitinophagaceae bacterium]|jgi:glycosyltransferase involved in cell wall biosynthesis|nr:glycosyltransferase family 4 protein [Chitinophagaceae bacterium]